MTLNSSLITHFFAVLLVAALLFMCGCSNLMESGNARQPHNRITQSNYAAADMLIQQSRSFLSQDVPIEIGMIADMDNPNEKTNFGAMVAEQIGSRFVQLGYNVTASQNRVGAPVMMTPEMAGQPVTPQAQDQTGRSAITGRYAVARDEVLVNLRIVEIDSGKVLAAYDYGVPQSRDVRELTKTQADKDSFFSF